MHVYRVTTVLLGLVICCQATGDKIPFPEPIERDDPSSFSCFGCNNNWRTSCANKANTVIGIQALKVGTKPRYLGCPESIRIDHDNQCVNKTCCSPDATNDCISYYEYTDAQIDYRFHKTCSGKPICDNSIEVVRASTSHTCSYATYTNYTNYFFMEYACVDKSRMYDMCLNTTYQSNDKTLYLRTPNFPNNATIEQITQCTCTLSTDDNTELEAYLIETHLSSLEMTINNGRDISTIIYDEHNTPRYNITLISLWNNSTISLENTSSTLTGEAKVWLGVKGKAGGDFTISCWGPSVEDDEPSRPIPIPSRSTAPGLSLGLILGIIGGLLFLLLVFCCVYHFFKKKKKRDKRAFIDMDIDMENNDENTIPKTIYASRIEAETKSGLTNNENFHAAPGYDENTVPKTVYTSSSNTKPISILSKNTKFKSAAISKAKVAPTPFIEEHGGIGGSAVPNSNGTVAPVTTNKSKLGSTNLKPVQPPTFQAVENEENEENLEEKPKKRKKKKKRLHREIDGDDDFEMTDALNIEPRNDDEDGDRKTKKKKKKKKRHRELDEGGDFEMEDTMDNEPKIDDDDDEGKTKKKKKKKRRHRELEEDDDFDN